MSAYQIAQCWSPVRRTTHTHTHKHVCLPDRTMLIAGQTIDNTVQVDTQRARILHSGLGQSLYWVTRTFPNIYEKWMAAAVVVCAQDKILSSLIFLCVQTYFDAIEQGCWYSLALLMESWYYQSCQYSNTKNRNNKLVPCYLTACLLFSTKRSAQIVFWLAALHNKLPKNIQQTSTTQTSAVIIYYKVTVTQDFRKNGEICSLEI